MDDALDSEVEEGSGKDVSEMKILNSALSLVFYYCLLHYGVVCRSGIPLPHGRQLTDWNDCTFWMLPLCLQK